MQLAFEQQANRLMALAAGTEVALDVRDVLAEARPELMIVDCMIPAGIAAGESTGTPTASLGSNATSRSSWMGLWSSRTTLAMRRSCDIPAAEEGAGQDQKARDISDEDEKCLRSADVGPVECAWAVGRGSGCRGPQALDERVGVGA
jgi:hypothetical protein